VYNTPTEWRFPAPVSGRPNRQLNWKSQHPSKAFIFITKWINVTDRNERIYSQERRNKVPRLNTTFWETRTYKMYE